MSEELRRPEDLTPTAHNHPTTIPGAIRRDTSWVSTDDVHSKGEPNQISAPEYEAAVQAGRVGRVLAAAEHSPTIQVPQAFGDLGEDIERLATRLHGFGLGKSIATDSLRQVSPAQMRCLVDNARKLGLLDEGQGWATKTTAARCIAREIGHVVEKNQFLDRGAPR